MSFAQSHSDRTAPATPLPIGGRSSLKLAPPPLPLWPLVGRAEAVAAICARWMQPEVRLMTLTGPGGVGKTRLALAVAADLAQDASLRVCFVDLAPIGDADLLAPAIARALGVLDTGKMPIVDQVSAAIADRRLLLILDNFEQILSAATLISGLLQACSRLRVLVTSRIPLRVSGEYEFEVLPLQIASTGEEGTVPEAAGEAVQLFMQRAQAVRPAFALTEANAPVVAEICRRVDGLPLAVELAAVRIKVLSAEALLSRLSSSMAVLTGGLADAPARQQTMRDAIGWSYELLSADEQALFRQLAVFAGGFSLEAAERVAIMRPGDGVQRSAEGHGAIARRQEAGANPMAFIDLLGSLVDRSLIRADVNGDGETRFGMFETIRAFGLEKLAESGEEGEARRRHAACFLDLVTELGPRMFGARGEIVADRLTGELPNLRAALEWSLATGDVETALRLPTGLQPLFWFSRVSVAEGLQWLEAALAHERGSNPARVGACCTASGLASLSGEYTRAVSFAERGLVLARAAHSSFCEARALGALGLAAEWHGDLDIAADRYESAAALLREIDSPYWLAHQLTSLANVTIETGDVARARRLVDEALAVWRGIENTWGIALAVGAAAGVALAEGLRRESAKLYRESLVAWQFLGDPRGVAGTVAGVAALAHAAGNDAQAVQLLAAARSIGDAAGVRHLTQHLQFERVFHATRARLGDEAFAAAWNTGRELSREEAVASTTAILDSLDRQSSGALSGIATLTRRETEVLQLLARGHTDREIGDMLSISPRTVMRHVANLYAKLDVGSRAAASAIAVRQGIA